MIHERVEKLEDPHQPPSFQYTDTIVYFTDVHFGRCPQFRSDNHFQAILKKLNHIRSIYEGIPETQEHSKTLLCGGDLFDTPYIVEDSSKEQGVLPGELLTIQKWFDETGCFLLNGNHGIRHEVPFSYQFERSPLKFFSKHMVTRVNTKNISISMKHWEPEYTENQELCPGKINILATHEPLMNHPSQFGVEMASYKTDFQYVLTADIHEFQGVNTYGNTTFISPGATTRTNSKEKFKIPCFAIIYIGKDDIEVVFRRLLPEDDCLESYWVDARIAKHTEKQVESIGAISIKSIERAIETKMETVDLKSLIQKAWKDNGGTEEEFTIIQKKNY